jgi:alkylated DNA repair dioxygenase AlkB
MATKRDALSAAQQELFSFSDQVELIELPFADIALHREFFSRTEADSYMSSLLTEINHGDVLIMKGQTQQHWEHQVPKSKAQASFGSRINLTFRAISDSYELGS